MAIISDISNTILTINTTSKSAKITPYSTIGREVSGAVKPTYSTANTFTPAATPTDIVMITGSATKTIRVVSIYLTLSNTASGSVGSGTFYLIKRGDYNTDGTFVPGIVVPHDSTDAASTVNKVGHYTANPTALGQSQGTLNVVRVASSNIVPSVFASGIEEAGIELLPWGRASALDKLPTLRGINESFVVNYNSAALLAGQTHTYRITWIEE